MTTSKLSCLPVSYFSKIISGDMSILSWLQEASDLGFDGADLSIHFLKKRGVKRLNEIKEAYETTGLKLALLNTYPQLLHPDTEVRQREIKQLMEDIQIAGYLGAENVRLVSGQWFPGVTKEEGIQRTLAGLEAVMETAEQCNVVLVFENHSKPAGWTYPDFSFNPEIFLEIYENLKTIGIKILFDTANPIAFGVDPLPLMKQVIDRVTCIHIADTSEKGKLVPSVIGKGLVPFNELFAYLEEINYSGWLSIEEASATGQMGVAAAYHYVRGRLNVGKSQFKD